MTEYVAGFMLDRNDRNLVALVRKSRPAWQAGRLNGIGGHVEDGESPDQAMVREFKEETGYQTTIPSWWPFAVLTGNDFRVHFYISAGDVQKLETKTDEEIVVVNRSEITTANAIPNLTWLIPMGVSIYHDRAYRMHITEEY